MPVDEVDCVDVPPLESVDDPLPLVVVVVLTDTVPSDEPDTSGSANERTPLTMPKLMPVTKVSPRVMAITPGSLVVWVQPEGGTSRTKYRPGSIPSKTVKVYEPLEVVVVSATTSFSSTLINWTLMPATPDSPKSRRAFLFASLNTVPLTEAR